MDLILTKTHPLISHIYEFIALPSGFIEINIPRASKKLKIKKEEKLKVIEEQFLSYLKSLNDLNIQDEKKYYNAILPSLNVLGEVAKEIEYTINFKKLNQKDPHPVFIASLEMVRDIELTLKNYTPDFITNQNKSSSIKEAIEIVQEQISSNQKNTLNQLGILPNFSFSDEFIFDLLEFRLSKNSDFFDKLLIAKPHLKPIFYKLFNSLLEKNQDEIHDIVDLTKFIDSNKIEETSKTVYTLYEIGVLDFLTDNHSHLRNNNSDMATILSYLMNLPFSSILQALKKENEHKSSNADPDLVNWIKNGVKPHKSIQYRKK